MEFETTWAVKYFFPQPSFIQIFYEAIANAFDANASNVEIEITSEPGKGSGTKHVELTISDDGEGFTDARFARFRSIVQPQDEYHKGLGRLVYLRYFSKITVSSVYGSSDKSKRLFDFDNSWNGGSCVKSVEHTDRTGTILKFTGFTHKRLRYNDNLNPEILKAKILEQFLPFFHKKKKDQYPFTVKITSNRQANALLPDQQIISASDIPELNCVLVDKTALSLNQDIKLYYLISPQNGRRTPPLIAACIDGRTIPIKLIGQNAIPVDHHVIFLFESPIFAGRSDSARQRLLLSDSIDVPALYSILRKHVGQILAQKLPEIEQKNTSTKIHFEEKYPHLIGLFQEETVGIVDREEALGDAQQQFFRQQKEILESEGLSDEIFNKSLDLSSRTLAEYILYRDFVIKKLKSLKKADLEIEHHNLIVPRFRRYEGISVFNDIYANNAWLLDDRFMSFRTILSEERMDNIIKEITKAKTPNNDDKPDICMIFSGDPDLESSVDVVVVEIKRKNETDKNNYYTAGQLAERATLLAQTCPNINRMWYYGILTIDEHFAKILETSRYSRLYSKGEVWYNELTPTRPDGKKIIAPLTLLDYKALVEDAASRNHAFLEILKNGFKQSVSNRQTNQSSKSLELLGDEQLD